MSRNKLSVLQESQRTGILLWGSRSWVSPYRFYLQRVTRERKWPKTPKMREGKVSVLGVNQEFWGYPARSSLAER